MRNSASARYAPLLGPSIRHACDVFKQFIADEVELDANARPPASVSTRPTENTATRTGDMRGAPLNSASNSSTCTGSVGARRAAAAQMVLHGSSLHRRAKLKSTLSGGSAQPKHRRMLSARFVPGNAGYCTAGMRPPEPPKCPWAGPGGQDTLPARLPRRRRSGPLGRERPAHPWLRNCRAGPGHHVPGCCHYSGHATAPPGSEPRRRTDLGKVLAGFPSPTHRHVPEPMRPPLTALPGRASREQAMPTDLRHGGTVR